MPLFHLAFPVTDLQATIDFYTQSFGCSLGRQAERWVDLDFYGHQLSCHVASTHNEAATNPVDGDNIRIPHFGVILDKSAWQALHQRLAQQGARFALTPKIRFEGQAGEQGTFFVLDPSNNTLEFKYFNSDRDIFAAGDET
ncbi:VOC family protein [bacterium]|nr:VOC family protein [bacterium]